MRSVTKKMGGGRLAQPFTCLPPGAEGGTHEHLKFAQPSFEEMGGTPIEHIAVQYTKQCPCQIAGRFREFLYLIVLFMQNKISAVSLGDVCTGPCPSIVQCSAY